METTERIEEYGQSASTEDLEEKLQDVQKIVNPITSKLYASDYAAGPDDDDQGSSRSHDKL